MLLMLLAGVSVITPYLATFTTFTVLPPAPAPPPDHWLALGVAAGGDQVTILPVSRLGRAAVPRCAGTEHSLVTCYATLRRHTAHWALGSELAVQNANISIQWPQYNCKLRKLFSSYLIIITHEPLLMDDLFYKSS